MSTYDVAVVGGSAAGLSAALVLARARRRVVVIDADRPRNRPAAHMHGFLSRDGLPPRDVVAIGREEVRSYGAELVEDTVVHATAAHEGLRLELGDGGEVSARRALIATGLRDELPAVKGLRERWARDVLHCPYCHGWEVRERRLGVIGGSADAVRYAQIVRQWSDDVVYFSPAATLAADERAGLLARSIQIVEGGVSRIVVADDRLHGVELDDGRTIGCDAVFVPPKLVPNAELLVGLGCALDDGGWPISDGTGRTSVPSVWVAGNVADPRAQVITAAGEGSAAALAINADLVDEDVRRAVAAFDRGDVAQSSQVRI
jgi:thioredoxin reductase